MFGEKQITEIELKEIEFGDLYEIKDFSQIGAREIGSVISKITGLMPPQVKKLGFKDAGFFMDIVTAALKDFQVEEIDES